MRIKKTKGFVNFPTHLESTREGGMYVRLVVLDTEGDKNWKHKWMSCCGGKQTCSIDNVFIGDDLTDLSLPLEEDTFSWELREDYLNRIKWKYFPNLEDDLDPYQYDSRSFLAIVLIGSTEWSRSDWVCTFDCLTDKGKELVESLKLLYTGCELRLLTFLDT
jgi:hypothetical protein